MRNRRFLLALAGLAVSLAACVSTPVPGLPEGDVPPNWGGSSETLGEWPAADWWRNFATEELNALVGQLEESNLDLEVNRLNLERARLALRDAGFDLLPVPTLALDLSGQYTGTEPDGESYSDDGDSAANLTLGLAYTDILSQPAQYAAERADYAVSEAAAVDTHLNTLATAASTYFQILLIRDRIRAAEGNVDNAEAIAKIAEARSEAGVIPPLEVLQQRISVENQKANLRTLRQNEYAARAALALMLARPVRDFDVRVATLENVVIPQVHPGLSSELLERRPDIVLARSSLARSASEVDLARVAYLPDISLTGSINLVSDSLRELLDASDLFVDATGSVAELLLDNGSRGRALESARLTLEASLASYRKVVIGAFNDIEVNLENLDVLADLERVAAENLGLAEEAFRIAEVRYREGAADYETVLTAQTTLFSSRNEFYDSKLARINAVLALYVALGGGWEAGDADFVLATESQ